MTLDPALEGLRRGYFLCRSGCFLSIIGFSFALSSFFAAFLTSPFLHAFFFIFACIGPRRSSWASGRVRAPGAGALS